MEIELVERIITSVTKFICILFYLFASCLFICSYNSYMNYMRLKLTDKENKMIDVHKLCAKHFFCFALILFIYTISINIMFPGIYLYLINNHTA